MFSEAGNFKNGNALVAQWIDNNKKMGLINEKGEFLLQTQYTAIEECQDNIYFAKNKLRGNHYEFLFINSKTEERSKTYDRALPFINGYSLVTREGQFYLLDISFNEINNDKLLKENLIKAYDFNSSVAIVKTGIGLDLNCAIFNVSGKQLSKEYHNIGEFSDGLAPAYIYSMMGKEFVYLKTNGKSLPDKYRKALPFKNGKAVVSNLWGKGKFGIIDTLGNLLVEYKYTDIKQLSEGFYAVSYIPEGEKYPLANYLDTNFNLLTDIKLTRGNSFSNGIAIVANKKQMYALMNTDGELVIDFNFNKIDKFSDGYARVMKLKNGKKYYGYIDTKGNVVFDISLFDASSFKEGLSIVAFNENEEIKYNLINKNFNVIGDSYLSIKRTNDYYLTIGKGNLYLINKKGNVINDNETLSNFLKKEYSFKNGVTVVVEKVRSERKHFLIDINGKIIGGKMYDYIYEDSKGHFSVTDGGVDYIIDKNGNKISKK